MIFRVLKRNFVLIRIFPPTNKNNFNQGQHFMQTGKSPGFFPPCYLKLTHFRLHLLALLFFAFFQSNLIAQPPIEWDDAYGGNNFEELQGLHQTPDGGFIYGCSTPSNISVDVSEPPIGGGDYWMVKTDAEGNILWDKRIGGDKAEVIQEIQPTSDGGYILGGWSYSGISGDKTEINNGTDLTSDMWVVKTDAAGMVEWDRSLGGDDNEQLYHIQETADGGFILGGWSASGLNGTKTDTARGGWDFYAVKLDALGNTVWDKTFGGSAFDMMLDIDEASDGSIYMGGWSASDISGDVTESLVAVIDYWVVKTDANGTKIWDKRYGGDGNDQIRSLEVLSDSTILFGGFSTSGIFGDKTLANEGLEDMWVIKADSSGAIIWQKNYGGTLKDVCVDLHQNQDGVLLIGGYSRSPISGNKTDGTEGNHDYWVIKANSEGDKIWDVAYGGSSVDILTNFKQIDDGGYILGGFTASNTSGDFTDVSQGFNDNWVVKLRCDLEMDTIPNDSICETASVTFDVSDAFCVNCTYLWNDGNEEDTRTVSPLVTTTYEVTITNSFGCDIADTTTIFVSNLPVVNLGPDFNLCEGDTVTLDAGNSNSGFLWSTGDTSQIIEVTMAGLYEVTVTNANACTTVDFVTINSQVNPIVNLGADQIFCQGESFALDAGNAGSSYSWSTNEGTQTIMVDTAGQYFVTVTNAFGCTGEGSINVIVNPLPEGTIYGDTSICIGETVPIIFNLLGNGPFDVVYSINGMDNTVNNINDGYTIDVSPLVTTTYTLESMTDSNMPACSIAPDQSVTVIVNYPISLNIEEQICAGDSILLQGAFQSTNGIYRDTLMTIAGCDSIIITDLFVAPIHETYLDIESCNPLDTGLVIYTLMNQYNCDSIIYETTSLLPSDTMYIELESCNPLDTGLVIYNLTNQYNCDSIIYETTSLLPSDTMYIELESCNPLDTGLVIYNLTNQYNCDSIIYETTSLLPSDTMYIDLGSCNPLDTGLVIYNLTNQYNCDSTIYETTTLLPSDTMYIDLGSCNPLDTGLVIYNLTNQYNCDSIIYETTSLLPSDTMYIELESCNPLDTGLVIYNLTNQYNCDSIIYETTSLLPSDTMYIDLESCNPLDTGLVIYNLTNQYNCDSIIYETTSLLPSDTMYIELESCNPLDTGLVIYNLTNQYSCDSIIYETTSLLPSDTMYIDLGSCNPLDTGLVIYNLTNQYNCDSIIYETTTLFPSDTMYIDLGSCNPLDTGLVIYNLTNQYNCDSVIYETTSLLPSDTIYLNLGSCNPQDTGFFIHNLTNQYNCDSIVLESVVFLESDTLYLFETSCNPQDTGLVSDVYTNENGCDSLVIIQTDFLLSDTTYFFETSCNPLDTGFQSDLYTNANGCDSLVIIETDLLLLDTTYQMVTSCDPTQVGETTEIIQTSAGCDSVIVITTSYLESDTTYFFETTCNPLDTGFQSDLYTNANGCDSLVIIETDLLLLDTTYQMMTSCDPTEVGEATEIIQTSLGCDSVIIITTSYLESDTTYFFEISCNPLDTGFQSDLYTNANGCDSLVIIETDLLLLDTTYQMMTSCDPTEVGEATEIIQTSSGCDSVIIITTSYLESDTTYFFEISCNPLDTGFQSDLYTNANGCDSLVIIQTDLLLLDTTYQMMTSCDLTEIGETTEIIQTSSGCDSVIVITTSYLESDTTYFFEISCNPLDTGFQSDLYTNANGCDSLVIIETDLLLLDTTYQMMTSCDPTEIGETTEIIQTSAGCDSVIIITTSYLESDTTYLFDTTCDIDQAGESTNLLQNAEGCDSLIITMTSYLESDTTYFLEHSCNPVDTGLFVTLENNQLGCDSIVYLQVSLLPSSYQEIFLETCNPQDTGVIINTFTNQYGCDSLEIITTDLLESNYIEIGLTTCDQDQIGQTTDVYQNQYGCDSIIITTTTLLPADETLYTSYTCDPQEVEHDTTWLTNVEGCDSIIINQVLLEEIDFQYTTIDVSCFGDNDGAIIIDSIIGGKAPYLFSMDDEPFIQQNAFYQLIAGEYSVNLMDADGCEGNENIMINSPPEFIIDLGGNRILALGDSVGLEPLSNLPIQSFTWAPTYNFNCDTCLLQIVKPLNTTSFQINAVSEDGCIDGDEVIIFVEKERNVFVPTAFSPDGDGNNDRFKVYTDQSVESIQTFRVFNRWGALVHEEGKVRPDQLEGWDGRYKGQRPNPGVYVYFVELTYIDGRVEVIKGDVTLLR